MLAIIDVSEPAASDKNKKITIPSLTSQLSAATTSTAGIVQLNDNINSTSTTQAATPNAVKTTYDLANGRSRLTLGTAQNSTSGTSIDFTGTPSWAKRVTVIFSGVSTNGSSIPMVRLGAGSIETTGYDSVASSIGTGVATNISTAGFLLNGGGAGGSAAVKSGLMTICNVSGNTWAVSFTGSSGQAGQASCVAGGTKTLAGALDRVRITTVNGTDTFDAGSINILYEG